MALFALFFSVFLLFTLKEMI